MDLFPDGTRVRLKNRERGTYLSADEDGVGVSLSAHRAAPNAAWEVRQETKLWDLHFACLLFRSAASGRYLALAPDHRGRRVAQRVYEDGDAHPGAFMWRAILMEHGRDDEFVILLHVLGLAVRADDGRLDGVAAAELDNISETMHWSAEVDAAPLPPALPHLALAEAGGHDGGEDPVDGADDDQQADAAAAVDGNGGVVLPADQNSPQREAARLYARLDDLYQLMERLCEEAQEHHQAILDVEGQAKAMGDWSGVRRALRPRYQGLEKIERSFDHQRRLASALRLKLVGIGFPPLEEPAGLRHPNHLRRW